MVFFGRKRQTNAQYETYKSSDVDELKNDSAAFHFNLTEDQRRALVQLMELYPDRSSDPRFGEYFFVRFLKARNFHVQKSTVMIDEYFRWRNSFEVDRIVENEQYPMASKVKQYYPHGYHGVDKEGRPIYIEQLGKVDVNKVLQLTDSKELCEYFVQEYEHLVEVILPCCSVRKGGRVSQTLTILDLKGFSMKTHLTKQTRQLTKEIMGVSQNYYPELLGQMIIINAPSYFPMIWSFVKPMLCEKTVSKIAFGQNKLFDWVDKDQLPDFLGGTRCSNEWYLSKIGPWADLDVLLKVKKMQKHVPPNLYLMSLDQEELDKITLEANEGDVALDDAVEQFFVRKATVDCSTS